MNLFKVIYTGANQAVELAGQLVQKAIDEKGKDFSVSFPNTAYSLPVIYAATGKKITTLGELEAAVGIAKSLVNETTHLQDALTAGLGTAVASEIIEALKYWQ